MDPVSPLEDFKVFSFVFEHTLPNAKKATNILIGCKLADPPITVTPY